MAIVLLKRVETRWDTLSLAKNIHDFHHRVAQNTNFLTLRQSFKKCDNVTVIILNTVWYIYEYYNYDYIYNIHYNIHYDTGPLQ